MKIVNYKLIILAILFLSFFIRIYDLGEESIWFDEGFSIWVANLKLSEIFFLQDTNPPLYHIFLHWWVILFGDSEFSIRLPSVIFSCISVFMMYNLGNKIFERSIGITGSLILGLSVFHIYYSQEARTYSLTILLNLFSMYFFVMLLQKVNYANLINYTLFSILLMYSHVYGLFILIAQNMYIIILFFLSKDSYREFIKKWILIQFMLIIFLIPWIKSFTALTIKIAQNETWIPIPSIYSIYTSFVTYSGSRLTLTLFLMLSLFSVIKYEKVKDNINWRNFFNFIGNYRWKADFSETSKIYLLLVWLLTPIILPFIISKFITPIYFTRYTIMASLAFYLLVSKGVHNINYKYFRSVIIIIVVSLCLLNISRYYEKIDKEQWRDAVNYIDENAKDDDLLLFHAELCQFIFDYYSKRTNLIKKPFPESSTILNEDIRDLRSIVESYNRVWVILSHSRDKKGLIVKMLNESYNLLFKNGYKGIKVYLFEKM